MWMRIRAKLDGHIYGRLTVTDSSTIGPPPLRLTMCTCRCDCGNFLTVSANALRSGNTKSCGCLRKDVAAAQSTTHGKSRTPEYLVWLGMRGRCNNPKNTKFEFYGGRGITVCTRWNDSFQAFIEDMGKKPSKKHEIERRDNDLGYSPENCYWATRTQQNNNTRHNRMLTWRGETHTLADWARIMRLPRPVVTNRLYRHWSIERALTTPVTD